jgi:hypothetical protein
MQQDAPSKNWQGTVFSERMAHRKAACFVAQADIGKVAP